VGGHCFSRDYRLLSAGDYRRVFEHAEAKASHRNLLLLATPNHLPHNRLGLVIAKKHVKLAVQRNRIKRITRESFRLNPDSVAGLDVIVLARKGCDRLDNVELSSILRQQWLKLAAHEPQ
jgi:ribonuclease P protein component